jgi:biopolymer transport protein ExbB/TolQ
MRPPVPALVLVPIASLAAPPAWAADPSGALHTGWLTGQLLDLARGGAEWILWVLVALSAASLAILMERLLFLRRVRTDAEHLRDRVQHAFEGGGVEAMVRELADQPSMQSRVLAFGLDAVHRGPEAVAELCRGAMGMERIRYERGLATLATIGSNAPFIGLFGTVMGVIMAFDQMRHAAGGAADAGSQAVMGAIAEALIATGVGLLVAIPAILFFNGLKNRVKHELSVTALLVDTAVARLRGTQSSG